MAKHPGSKSADIEFEPDAWERFERAVNVVAKSPPQHRTAKGDKSMAPKRAHVQPKKRKKTKAP
jgi:hypothetical protein